VSRSQAAAADATRYGRPAATTAWRRRYPVLRLLLVLLYSQSGD